MIRKFLLGASLSVLVCLVASTAVAQATRVHNVDLLVTHADFDASPNDYSLSAFQSGHSESVGPITDQRLIAPDGTVFKASSTRIVRNSLAQIAATVLGTWTAFETLGGIESSYRFNVLPTTLDNLPAIPVITSPRNGAIVGETFDVHWMYPDGDPPETIAFQYLQNPNLEIVDIEGILGSLSAIRFETNLLAPRPQRFEELQVIRAKSLPMPSFVDSTPDLAGDDFQFEAHFDAVSRARTFYVVPEPGGIALAMTLGLLLALAHDRIRAIWAHRSRPAARR